MGEKSYFMFLELVTSYGHRGFKGKYISERHIGENGDIPIHSEKHYSIESSTRTDGRIERSYRGGNGGRGGGGGGNYKGEIYK